jgi:chaperonin GroEL (HSP60 family)
VSPTFHTTFRSIFLQDKVLVSIGPHKEGIQVTNDGATILKSIRVDIPAAKVLVGEPWGII